MKKIQEIKKEEKMHLIYILMSVLVILKVMVSKERKHNKNEQIVLPAKRRLSREVLLYIV